MNTKSYLLLSLAWALLILIVSGFVSASAAGDPIADYQICAAQGLSRIDAGINELWRGTGPKDSTPINLAQADTQKCLDAAIPAANAALANDRDRLHALHWHYAKMKSAIALRLPDRAVESKRKYAERIAQDDAAISTLWSAVVDGGTDRTTLLAMQAPRAKK